jgi:hypothetical protein
MRWFVSRNPNSCSSLGRQSASGICGPCLMHGLRCLQDWKWKQTDCIWSWLTREIQKGEVIYGLCFTKLTRWIWCNSSVTTTALNQHHWILCIHNSIWWNWRTSFWMRLAWPKRPKTICSPSYVDVRSRANTTRGLDFDHMIKREHTREIWG